jgi:hypothetical protein
LERRRVSSKGYKMEMMMAMPKEYRSGVMMEARRVGWMD